MFKISFFPKNTDFFKLFEQQADELDKAAKLLAAIKKGDGDFKKNATKIKQIEHNADEITHEIIRSLNQTFITPIDREDITMLASQLDNVVDELDRAINRIYIYRVKPVPPEIKEYCQMIACSIEELCFGVRELKNHRYRKKLLDSCEKVNSYENKTDDLHREVLGKLLNSRKNPLMVIKLKEIYDTLESVTDRCEDAANALETIVIKNL